jgi:hypothetical protein
MLKPDIIESFLTMVTDGDPIYGYEMCHACNHAYPSEKAEHRKESFLRMGEAILYHLSLRLGCFGLNEKGEPFVHINRAGPIVSGEVSLIHPDVKTRKGEGVKRKAKLARASL